DAAPADVEGPLPLGTRRRDHAATAADARVVEQEVDLVGVLLVRHLVAEADHLRLVRYVCDVGRDALALAQAGRFAQRLGLRHGAGGDVAHGDVTAFRYQLAHQLPSHARASAGDNGDPAGKLL